MESRHGMWMFAVLAVVAALGFYGEWMLLRNMRAMAVRSVAHLQAIRAMSLECQVTRKATEELVAGEEAARVALAERLKEARGDSAALLKIVSGVAEFQMKQKAWLGEGLATEAKARQSQTQHLEELINSKVAEAKWAFYEEGRLDRESRAGEESDRLKLVKELQNRNQVTEDYKAWMGDELASMENRLTNVLTERARSKDTASRVLRPKTGTQFRNMVENASETEGTDANRA